VKPLAAIESGTAETSIYSSIIYLLVAGFPVCRSGINIKKLQSTFKRSCYRPCSHRSKTAKIKRERERGGEKGIAEIIHLMKPITRSPDTTTSSSSSSSIK
jgi:hypothetical protein